MIVIKTPEEIEKMANACCIVAEILKDMKAFVKPGVSTKEMEMFAEEKIYNGLNKIYESLNREKQKNA